MSLMICPDCGNECSTAAANCPNCGHPFARRTPTPNVIVQEVPVRSEFPKWIFVPIAIMGAVLIFFLIMFMQREDETANRNSNIRLTTTPLAQSNTRTESREIVVPSTSNTPQIVVPQSAPVYPTDSQTIETAPATAAMPISDKGILSMEAKVLDRSGSRQSVTKETFYLLDKDLQSILSEAGIDDPEGQGVVNSFGLSVINPAKYREVNQKALAAINRHIVYRTLTDGQGKAEIKDIKPDSYYLFGITKTRNGFAIWDSPVSIQAGQNNLVLEPKTPTEVVTNSQF